MLRRNGLRIDRIIVDPVGLFVGLVRSTKRLLSRHERLPRAGPAFAYLSRIKPMGSMLVTSTNSYYKEGNYCN